MRVIDYFDRGAAICPDRPLVVSDAGVMSYASAAERSWEIGTGLRAAGLEVGDRVGVLAPNVADAFIAMLGIWRAGCSWVPLNYLNPLPSTLSYAAQVRCRAIFVHSHYADQVEEIRGALPDEVLLVGLDRSFGGALAPEAFTAGGRHGDLPDWSDPHGAPDAEACAWPTGGTTGRSKAVLWTNAVWASLIETATRHWPPVEHPVNLLVAPITHGAGVMALIFTALGATIVIRRKFDAADALDQIERRRVTHLFLPPTAYYGLLDRQATEPRDCSSLALLLLSAAPVSPDRLAEGVAHFGPCIGQSWGQAEAPLMLTYLSPGELAQAIDEGRTERLGSCGRATFSSQVAVMGDDGRLLAPRERGELVARSRLVTPGYLDDPRATAEIRTHGWHHTGDIGYLDEDGYAYIVDRKKDMVISGGFNVYPAEVEAAILAMPEVRECAVIGVPDAKWGEMVFAVVIPTDREKIDGPAVIARARERLGPIKAPKAVAFVDALPMTAVGKVDKKALRSRRWTLEQT